MVNLLAWIPLGGIILALLALLLGPSIKIVSQYERGVVFRFGRLVGVRGPGLNFIIPYIDRMFKVDTRVVTMTVEPQEVITKDNVTIKVDAVVYFMVVNPQDALVKVVDYNRATSQIALTTLRSVLGQSELDEILSQRDEINRRLRQIIDEHTEPWGVKVTAVELKDIQLPEAMQRAMARQAEAEREKRAKIIHAEGEYLAAERLSQAGQVIAQEPVSLQLRYLQTLVEMAGERSSTIIPLPIDLVNTVMEAMRRRDQDRREEGA